METKKAMENNEIMNIGEIVKIKNKIYGTKNKRLERCEI